MFEKDMVVEGGEKTMIHKAEGGFPTELMIPRDIDDRLCLLAFFGHRQRLTDAADFRLRHRAVCCKPNVHPFAERRDTEHSHLRVEDVGDTVVLIQRSRRPRPPWQYPSSVPRLVEGVFGFANRLLTTTPAVSPHVVEVKPTWPEWSMCVAAHFFPQADALA